MGTASPATRLYVEHRRTVTRHGPLSFLPLDSIQGQTGFRSVYAFDEALVRLLRERDTVGGLDQAPVWSDTLFVDFDSDSGVDAAVAVLQCLGVGFEVWDTGRRGVHLHIPCSPMFGSQVPASQHAWVKEHFTGDWDPTLYRPHAIFRLPGTWHEKNPGHAKQLRARENGPRLEIPILPAPPRGETAPRAHGDRNAAEFWTAVGHAYRGPRTHRVYFLGRLAADCAVEFEDGLAAAKTWATTLADPPMANEREILRVFENGYRRQA